MKNVLFIFITFMFCFNSHGQLRYEGQFGGANFLGYTVNVEDQFHLGSKKTHAIGVSMGAGISVREANLVTRAALNYYFLDWGIGVESALFSANPLVKVPYTPDLGLSIYPNVSYTLQSKKKPSLYFRFSAGIFLPHGQSFNPQTRELQMGFLGDPIPMIGFSFGNFFVKRE